MFKTIEVVEPGVFWFSFISNDFQMYVLLLLPVFTLYYKGYASFCRAYLVMIMFLSMLYTFGVSYRFQFSTLPNIIPFS